MVPFLPIGVADEHTLPDGTILRDGLCDIDAEGANFILTRLNYPSQRKISRDYSDRCAADWKDGNWHDSKPVLKFAVFEGQVYLVDGQHRLVMVVSLKTVKVPFAVQYHPKSTWSEVEKMYDSLDQGKARNLKDVAAGHGTSMEEADFAIAMSAVKVISAGFQSPQSLRISPVVLKDWVRVNETVFADYFALIEHTPMERALRSQFFVALGYILLSAHPEKARTFFYRVANQRIEVSDEFLEATSPEYLLTLYLGGVQPDSGQPRRIRVAAKCWTAYFQEKALSKRPNVESGDRTMDLAGTDYWDGIVPRLLFGRGRVIWQKVDEAESALAAMAAARRASSVLKNRNSRAVRVMHSGGANIP